MYPEDLKHFNSRPSARGDNHSVAVEHNVTISIHAPPRGATAHVPQHCRYLGISIHAPPRGATRRFLGNFIHFENFNSRPSARGDAERGEGVPEGEQFQFTPLREGRRRAWTSLYCYTPFQFTPLREGRLRLNVT